LGSVLTSWLGRVTNRSRVGVGFFAHNRSDRDARRTAGAFVEVFPMINEIESDDTFVSLIRRVTASTMESLRHSRVGASDPRYIRDLNVVFNSITATRPDFPGRTVSTRWVHNGHSDPGNDLRVQFHDLDGTGDLTALFDFADETFDARQRDRVVAQFLQVLDACIADPRRRLAEVSIVGEDEARELRAVRTVDSPPTTNSSSGGESVDDVPVRRFEAMAARFPDRVACVAQDGRLTYRELDRAANALAHRLAETDGVRGGVVAVSTERTTDFIVAVMAAHKAGAAYLPIDPREPLARRQELLEAAAAAAVITDQSIADAAPSDPTDSLPTLHVEPTDAAAEPPDVDLVETDRAYLIGTSGSTGTPKIIQIEHRNLAHVIDGLETLAYRDRADDQPLDVALVAPFGFDPSVQQIFPALTLGHTLHVVPSSARLDGDELHSFLVQHDIDITDGTPAHMRMLLDGTRRDLGELDLHFLIGGDVIPVALARRFLERATGPNVVLTNLYGPAECSVDSTAWTVRLAELSDHPTVPIGRPLPGVSAVIVDERANLQPFGVTGELVLGGDGVGRGYLGAPELNAEKFEPDPDVPGGVRYRTGDLARMSPDGVIEFVDRNDLMVKILGNRVELSEVATALASYRRKKKMIPLRIAEPVRCERCLLSEQHPGVTITDGVCSTCRAFEAQRGDIAGYFGAVDDFEALIRARSDANSDYDCMLLYSGGKDSSYVLYRLAELGLRVLAFTFDNGHISDAAFANIQRQTSRLGIDSIVMDAEHMDEIFLQSLNEESTVCDGCFRALTALSTKLAIDRGIGTVVTGLSRGQIFDTKLGPLITQGITDVDEIERHLMVFRSGYHSRSDLTNALLDIDLDTATLESMDFVDWFRYDDASTAEVKAYLQAEDSYWSQPEDTGFCSTNCRMNDVGIAVHSATRGFHNYEQPLSWDIRLGLLDRADGLAEVQPPEDRHYVEGVLDDIGYLVREVQDAAVTAVETDGGVMQLHAFYVSNQTLTVDELRAHMAERVPRYMNPSRFFRVDEIPLTENGKVDRSALTSDSQRPELIAPFAAPSNDRERELAAIWSDVLGIERIGVHDGFFAIGGDSILALEVAARAADAGLVVTPAQVFSANTIAGIVAAVESAEEHEASPSEAAQYEIDRSAGGPVPSVGDDPPPLTLAEQSLLVTQDLRPDDRMFNVAAVYEIDTTVDIDRLEAAARLVVDQHEPLHWTFEPQRRRLSPSDALEVIVEPTRDAANESGAIDDALERVQLAPHDLRHGPLLRVLVQPCAGGTTIVSLNLHHISIDHGGFDTLWSAITAAYEGRPVPPPPVSLADLDRWQQTSYDAAQRFWAGRSVGARLALDERRSAVAARSDGYVEVVSAIGGDELRTARGRTIFTTALTAAAAAVRPLTEGDDVEVGLIASTKNHELARPLVGYLLNPLPHQFEVRLDRTFGELADEVAASTADALEHVSYPFIRMVEDARRAGRTGPAGQVFVAVSDEPSFEFDGAGVRHGVRFNGSAVTDLTLFVRLHGSEVTLGLEYSAAVGREAADMVLHSFDAALTALLRTPAATISSLPLDTTTSVRVGEPLGDVALSVTEMLSHRGRPTSAVEVGNDHLVWSEFVRRAEAVAAHLREIGVQPGDRVVVRCERSVHVPVAMLGVLLARASYVPFAADTADTRVHDAVGTIGASVEIQTSVPGLLDTSLVIDERGMGATRWADLDDAGSAMPTELPRGDDEAYVIFTSGSTGRPNPVAITHAQISASTAARDRVYSEEPSRFGVLSGLGFDSSLVGLWWTLARGGTVVLSTEAASHDIDAQAQLLAAGDLSHTLCVPTLYGLLLGRRPSGSSWPAHVIVAGEACSAGLVAHHLSAASSTALTNEYGPTEGSVWATVEHLVVPGGDDEWPADETPPIGGPIPGTWLAVVDAADRVVPAGVIGELVIGGPNVAHGYVGSAEHPRFGEQRELRASPGTLPGGPHDRIFRTGDRALVDGDVVYFLGRADGQLNIGGVRIDPAEIESVLGGIDGVDAAVVVAVDVRSLDELVAQVDPTEAARAFAEASRADDPAASLRRALAALGDPDLRLVAHVATSVALDVDTLRFAANGALGPQRRPQIYVVHDDLPRTQNGKIDRQAVAGLPLPERAPSVVSAESTQQSSGSPWPGRIEALFTEVLRLESPIRHDQSFFDLGGDSLRALEVLGLLFERHDVDLPAAAVHRSPTVEALAERIEGRTGSGHAMESADEASTSSVAELLALDDEFISLSLQTTGAKTPIFALHNIRTEGALWKPLVDGLALDHPFHCVSDIRAVFDRFHERDVTGHRSLLDTATRYVEAIRRACPDGPVILAGYCQGGLIAYEAAQQLTDLGIDVEQLLIVHDQHAPNFDGHRGLAAQARSGRELRGQSQLGYLVAALRRGTFVKPLAHRAKSVAVVVATKFGLPLPDSLAKVRDAQQVTAELHAYAWQPYDGAVRVLRSRFYDESRPEGERDGWGGYVDDVEVAVLSGVGDEMLEEPFVAEAVAVVRKWLDPDDQSAVSPEMADATLIEAIHSRTLTSVLPRLLAANPTDSCRAVDDLTERLAIGLRAAGDDIVARAAAADVEAALVPVPDRTAVPLATLASPEVERLAQTLLSAGYDVRRIATDEPLVFSRPDAPWRFSLVETPSYSPVTQLDGVSAVAGQLGGFLGTPRGLIAPLLDAVEAERGELIVDLGCGDARVLVEAVQASGLRGRGVESDPDLVDVARANVADAGLADRVDIVHGDARSADIDDADIVFVFVPPDAAAELIGRCVPELRADARLVVHETLPIEAPIPADRTEVVISDPAAPIADAGLTVASIWTGPTSTEE